VGASGTAGGSAGTHPFPGGQRPELVLGAATHTVKVLERARVEDHVVDNADRPLAVVAEEVLRQVGWLDLRAGA
jgi:hypothetical protein